MKKDFAIDIFKFILEHHRPENVFQFEITADIVHPDIVAFIHEHIPKGLFRFEIGIQTVNPKANLQVSRKQNFDKTAGVIKQLDSIIEMHLDLIVGLPLDEWGDIKYSIEEVFKLHPPELQLGFLKFLRGTPMRHKHEQHGYKFDPEPPYQIIESNYLSKEELFKITLLEEALEIYWNKNRAVNTLKYVSAKYSIFEFLLGLGTHFHQTRDFHQHTLYDIYDALMEFALENFSEDKVLQQLIAVDYYLPQKVKPQVRYLSEVEQAKRVQVIEERKLNHHKYRYVIMELDFDFKAFVNSGKIKAPTAPFIIQYTGGKIASEVL